MKYFVLIPDGMADEPIESLGNRTPMQAAFKPTMDQLAAKATVGTVSNVPAGMVPESDTANMAILSFNPKIYSKGRSPLEAVSMGIEMLPDETAYRCNVVTLSDNGEDYDDKIILDHSADEITTEEADQLIRAMQEHFGNAERTFHTGVSYRHCLIIKNGNETYPFMRPHDILGKRIGEYLPHAENGGGEFYRLMRESFEVLNHHPVNEARRARGLKPANSIWLWSPGKKPALPDFQKQWGLNGAVISAVDLIKGIGLCAGMRSIDVEGATGNVHTNYAGKAAAAIGAFREGYDYVYVHVEAPDECGHRAELENKILSIEKIDAEILKPVYDYLAGTGEPFRIMVLPDHPTPVRLRTHTILPVPFFIYSSDRPHNGVEHFDEKSAAATSNYLPCGYRLMELLTAQDTGNLNATLNSAEGEEQNVSSVIPTEPLWKRIISGALDYLEMFSWAVFAVLLIFTFGVRLCRVDGESMENTLYDRQTLLFYSAVYKPSQDDIIVFHLTRPEVGLQKTLVKRVIATGGQEVVIDTNANMIIVDGIPYADTHSVLKNKEDEMIGYYYQALFRQNFDSSTGIFRAIVPENCVFVMGDNRNNSKDSRNPDIGFVDTRCILGKVAVRFYPFAVFS